MRARFRLAALAVAGLGCRNATAPVAAPTVRAAASAAAIPAGRALAVDVTITNATTQEVAISGGAAPAFLEVRDAADHVVAFGRFEILSLIATGTRRLEPGESVSDRAPWAGELNAGGLAGTAAPGRYAVRAAVPYSAAGTSAYAYSAPVAVSLTGP